MGESRTCDFCFAKVPKSDFAAGHAVVVLKKVYCRTCLDRAVRQKTKNPRDSGRHPRPK
ncbi:MAG: hypothetical protein JO332_03130 [Planctomycetaceae bacterium]|nr:hypothetical protein [Planctomycetaceae bacterium]